MEINLDGDILILDEAHNMEDTSRESASFDVSEENLKDVEGQLQRMLNQSLMVQEHSSLLFLVQQMEEWILNTPAKSMKEELDHRIKTWAHFSAPNERTFL